MKRKRLGPKKLPSSVNKRAALETGALAALELSRRPAAPKFSINFPIPVYDEQEHVMRAVTPDSKRCLAARKIYDRIAGETLADFQARVCKAAPRGAFLLIEPDFGEHVPQIEANPFPDDPDAERVKRMKPRELFAYMFEKMAARG